MGHNKNAALSYENNVHNQTKLVPAHHQIEANDKAVEALMHGGRAKVIMACGTGKTLVGAMVASNTSSKLVTIFAPSIALVKQILDVWVVQQPIGVARILCVCSDDTINVPDELQMSVEELGQPVTTDPLVIRAFLAAPGYNKIIFSTYHSAEAIGAALPDGVSFDIGIFDEAHRTAGSEGKGFDFALFDQNIRISRRLFLTATPKQFDSDHKTKEGDLIEVRSMDDENIYGKTVYTLSFLEAVRRDLIVDFKVVVSVVIGEEIRRDLFRNGLMAIADSEIEVRHAANLIAMRKCAKELALSKAFTFHETIKRAKTFAQLASELPPTNGEVTMTALHLNGSLTSRERDAILHEFDLSTHALLSNVRCLTEGVDVPAVDMVAFMSPKRSTQEIVQACGRAMRKAKGKSCGYVFLPILIELGHGDSVETALARTKLGPLWDVLEAMTECDENIYEALRRMRRARGNNQVADVSAFDHRIIVQGPEQFLVDIRKAVTAMAVTNLTATWEEFYGLLQGYFDKYGHSDTPSAYKVNDLDLGGWVQRQRSLYRSGALKSDRKNLLDQIGFTWEFEDDFETLFAMLESFQAVHGHCDVRKSDGQKLFSWICNLRKNRQAGLKKGYLSLQERIDRLDNLGFNWVPVKELKFESRFNRLVQYFETHGRGEVNIDLDKDLYNWILELRKLYANPKRRKSISNERIERLNSIGFVWSYKDLQWDSMFDEYLQYKEKNNGKEPPSDCRSTDGRLMSGWLSDQRKHIKNGRLDLERKSRFEATGFILSINEDDWERNYLALQEYKEMFGDCHLPSNWQANLELASWISIQRRVKRDGKLTKERELKLNSLDFPWTSPYAKEQGKWRSIFRERESLITGKSNERKFRSDFHFERYVEFMTLIFNGHTYSKIGAMYDCAHSNVREKIMRLCKLLLSPEYLDEPMPNHNFRNFEELKLHKDFWMRRLDKFKLTTQLSNNNR